MATLTERYRDSNPRLLGNNIANATGKLKLFLNCTWDTLNKTSQMCKFSGGFQFNAFNAISFYWEYVFFHVAKRLLQPTPKY